MRFPVDQKTVGPWPCEKCGKHTQYAKQGAEINSVYCVNPYCYYERIVDKKKRIVVEDDGRRWNIDAAARPGPAYDNTV
jgi:hypothetical protein